MLLSLSPSISQDLRKVAARQQGDQYVLGQVHPKNGHSVGCENMGEVVREDLGMKLFKLQRRRLLSVSMKYVEEAVHIEKVVAMNPRISQAEGNVLTVEMA